MDSRFQPVSLLSAWKGGILVLKDTNPSAGEFDVHEFQHVDTKNEKDAASPKMVIDAASPSASVKSPRLSPEHTSPSTSNMMEED